MRRISLIAAILALVSTIGAQSHYYVDAIRGNDNNAGTMTLPFKSITKGVTSGQLNTVIHVFPGTYSVAATNEAFPIVFGASASNPHQKVKLLGSGYQSCKIDLGSAAAGAGTGIRVTANATDIEIAGFSILNGKTSYWWDTAVHLNACKNVNFHDCLFEKCNRAFTNFGDAMNVALHNNIMVSTANDAIPTNNTAKATVYIYNNLIIGAQKKGMWLGDKAPGLVVVNNIVINCVGDGIWDPFPAGPARPTILNNCCFGNGGLNFGVKDPLVVIDKSNITVDPQLTDITKGLYTLKSTSPCIDKGYPIGMPYMVNDIFGNARAVDSDSNGTSIPEIGVHEVTDYVLTLTNWGQGNQPIVKIAGTPANAFLMVGYRPFSLLLSTYGIIAIDPTSLLVTGVTGIPTPPTYAPLGTLPKDPLLTGLPIYIQALSFKKPGSNYIFAPTGRLNLYL